MLLRITEETKRKIDAKFPGWDDSPCPTCSNKGWWIGGAFAELKEFHGGALYIGGGTTPALVLTCDRCGYMKFFNAVVLGLIDQKNGMPIEGSGLATGPEAGGRPDGAD